LIDIIGSSKPPPTDIIDVERFPTFFDDVIGRIRSDTSVASPPIFSIAQTDVQLCFS
jgi:hypothetical protein